MTSFQRISLFLLRLGLGWLFFYAGLTKLLNPSWSAAGYLGNAKTFPWLYEWLASPTVLPVTNFLNEWGLTLIGAALILGIAVRFSSILGAVMMFLYYLPTLDFPYPNAHALIVDEHIVYLFAFLVLAGFRAGHVWGLGAWCAKCPWVSKLPAWLRE